jgi:hypothetical protein
VQAAAGSMRGGNTACREQAAYREQRVAETEAS